MEYDKQQRLAIERCLDMSLSQRVVPITGRAGTGKTTLLKAVFDNLVDAGYDVALCSPTGKAAKRITEVTGVPASTIHRLLKYPYPGERDPKTGEALAQGQPAHNRNNPMPHDVILCDEYAMVNREVHSNLIFAMKSGSCIRMFGDNNQLQPIEPKTSRPGPSPFTRALEKFNGVTLDHVHRTVDGSTITMCAGSMLEGKVPRPQEDFRYHYTDQPVKLLQREFENPIYATTKGQLIAPTKKSWVGTIKLNLLLRDMIGPVTDRIALDRHEWDKDRCLVGVGDKVIWTENQYDMRSLEDQIVKGEYGDEWTSPALSNAIMNGESGLITEIGDDHILIDVGDRVVYVPRHFTYRSSRGIRTATPYKHIQLGYVITTHKAQGSEYDRVCYVINKSSSFMHCRPNIYTAITRAKAHVDVITDQMSITNSVRRTESLSDRKYKR